VGFRHSQPFTQQTTGRSSAQLLAPGGLIPDGAISVSKMITLSVECNDPRRHPRQSKFPGVILPGFIDLHNHHVECLARWVRREVHNAMNGRTTPNTIGHWWPHNMCCRGGCETEIYAESRPCRARRLSWADCSKIRTSGQREMRGRPHPQLGITASGYPSPRRPTSPPIKCAHGLGDRPHAA